MSFLEILGCIVLIPTAIGIGIWALQLVLIMLATKEGQKRLFFISLFITIVVFLYKN
ncbi:MAG: hypothetical protein LBU35_02210 [Holosporales bacterium]|nr:hypothetical protein [Holosporales bacterium]